MANRPLKVIQSLWLTSLAPAVARYEIALRDPERAQARRLRRLVRDHADSAYGRAHGFAGIGSLGDYRRCVPVVDYEALRPWIDRVGAGEPSVLVREPVRMMERSGGSTAANKLVPYGPALLADFSAATHPWLFDLHRRNPSLVGTRSYWSLSPVAQGKQRTPGGLPIGMDDDTGYFGPIGRFALRQMMAVPSQVAHLADMESWREATLRHLLAAEDLGFISVWSPTFLSLLMAALADQLDLLLAALPPARRDAIRRGLDRAGTLVGEAIWPALRVISCWMDGASAELVAGLRRYFPRTPLQPKGLLATEGVVSLPYGDGPGAPLALTSHFLEFIDLDAPAHLQDRTPHGAHELRVGGQYSPLLSTGGGFYRYHLKDVVECVGRERNAPRVRFVGKLDSVSDVCGEKVNARQVEAALARAQAELGVRCEVALVAPVWPGEAGAPVHYCLFADGATDDGSLARIAVRVEDELLAGHAFRYARELGQLGPMRVARLHGGRAAWQETLVRAGQRAGDIKAAQLDTRRVWAERFGPGRPARALAAEAAPDRPQPPQPPGAGPGSDKERP